VSLIILLYRLIKRHWELALFALGAAVVAFLLWQVTSYKTANQVLSEDLAAAQGEVSLLRAAREADAIALAKRQELRTIIIEREAHGLSVTQKALANNPDWASQPIPPAVLDSLR